MGYCQLEKEHMTRPSYIIQEHLSYVMQLDKLPTISSCSSDHRLKMLPFNTKPLLVDDHFSLVGYASSLSKSPKEIFSVTFLAIFSICTPLPDLIIS